MLGELKLFSSPATTPYSTHMQSRRRKEAADEKIKEMLRTFVTTPQTRIVYFGGGHDSGYGGLVHPSTHLNRKLIIKFQGSITLPKPRI